MCLYLLHIVTIIQCVMWTCTTYLWQFMAGCDCFYMFLLTFFYKWVVTWKFFFWRKFFVLNNRWIFFRSLPATNSTNYVIAIIIGLVCVVTLLLPTQQEVPHPSNIPAYLHVSVNFKLVLAYVLGLVSMVIFKPWTKDVAYVLSWQFLYVKFGDK